MRSSRGLQTRVECQLCLHLRLDDMDVEFVLSKVCLKLNIQVEFSNLNKPNWCSLSVLRHEEVPLDNKRLHRFGSRGAQSPVRLLGKPDGGMDAHFDVDGVQ